MLRIRHILLKWLSVLLIIAPSPVKIFFYRRVYGHKIGKHVRIGLTWIDVDKLEIGDHVVIGHFNRIKGIPEVRIGNHTTIATGNTFTSTSEFTKPDAIAQRQNCPKLIIGEHCGIAMLHYFDVQDAFTIGEYTTIAGVYSVFFTHYIDVISNLQSAKPIKIGKYCMVGSSVRFAPGTCVPDYCVIGMGSIVTKTFNDADSYTLLAGNPARVIRQLPRDSAYFHRSKGAVLSFTQPIDDLD
jgi:acetyltransferase-like isoleucine patch superfamily enzyme